MRWLTFMMLALMGITLQTTLAERVELWGVRPEGMVVLLVFYGLRARNTDGILAAFALGLLVDLTTIQPLGIAAVVYALVGLAIYGLRPLLFTRSLTTSFYISILAATVVVLLLFNYYRWSSARDLSLGAGMLRAILTGCYTALWGVPIQWLLGRWERLLGLNSPPDFGRRRVRVARG
ncbi:MAG: hypothetical protein HJJLKODD_01241 [Phycisphaerae bacterium]|nr:hypothetical protein [Phycisphaerae bacterium]